MESQDAIFLSSQRIVVLEVGQGVWTQCAHEAAAQVVGDKFGMGMDDTHMAIRGAPVLDEPALSPEQKMIADKLTVSELMSMAVVALPPIVRVRPS